MKRATSGIFKCPRCGHTGLQVNTKKRSSVFLLDWEVPWKEEHSPLPETPQDREYRCASCFYTEPDWFTVEAMIAAGV